MNSLERRLQINLGTTVVLLMALLGWLVITITQQLTEEFALTRLQHDAESLLAALQFDGEGRPSLKREQLSTIYHRPLSGHYYQIHFDSGTTITSRSLWDTQLQAVQLTPGTTLQRHSDGPAEQQLLEWAASYTKQGHQLTLIVAEDITSLRKNLLNYSLGLAALTLIALAVLLLMQKWSIAHTLRPLHRLSRELDQLERGEIEKLTDEVPLEVRPLVTEVNRLLTLMGQRLQRSRSALGNLAHALKSPLNRLVQLSDSRDIEAQPALKEELQHYTRQLHELIDHELRRARLAGAGGAVQRFEAREEIPAIIALMQRIYADKPLAFDTVYPQGAIQDFDRNDLLELIGNLLDNACKWAAQRVAIQFEVGEALVITIEDDGPGVEESLLPTLLQRGTRLDESIPGHGLGLSIVHEIVELYHGKIAITRSEQLGGLRVRVELYLTPPSDTATTE